MKDGLITAVENWVKSIYANSEHLIRTGYWIRKLDPSATDAMYIAAITHDIERAFPAGRTPPSSEMAGAKWDDPVYNSWHGKRSAKFVTEFLKENGTPDYFVEDVAGLVGAHEDGGWKEANFLRDADSISFLEVNARYFISKVGKGLESIDVLSKEDVRAKFDYMFGRIEGLGAIEIARPYYEKALRMLEEK